MVPLPWRNYRETERKQKAEERAGRRRNPIKCEGGMNLPRPHFSLWLANLGAKILTCFVKDWYAIVLRVGWINLTTYWISLFAQQKTKHNLILKTSFFPHCKLWSGRGISHSHVSSGDSHTGSASEGTSGPHCRVLYWGDESTVLPPSLIQNALKKKSPDPCLAFLKRACDEVRKLLNKI